MNAELKAYKKTLEYYTRRTIKEIKKAIYDWKEEYKFNLQLCKYFERKIK